MKKENSRNNPKPVNPLNSRNSPKPVNPLAVPVILLLVIVFVVLIFATHEKSDFVAVETYDDLIPSSLSLDKEYGYLRIALSRERLNELIAATADPGSKITVEPGGRIIDSSSAKASFSIQLTSKEIQKLSKTLNQHPEQQSIAPIKRIPIQELDASSYTNYPENAEYIVHVLLTSEDVDRLANGIISHSSDQVSISQPLGIKDKRIAELPVTIDALMTAASILQSTNDHFVALSIIMQPDDRLQYTHLPTTKRLPLGSLFTELFYKLISSMLLIR